VRVKSSRANSSQGGADPDSQSDTSLCLLQDKEPMCRTVCLFTSQLTLVPDYILFGDRGTHVYFSGKPRNFEKGKKRDKRIGPSSFIANAHNEQCAFHTRKSDLQETILRPTEAAHAPLNPPLVWLACSIATR